MAITTGTFSSKFKFVMEAIKTAAETALQQKDHIHPNVVLLTDAQPSNTALK
jgi:hypothetical protein